MDEVTFQIFKQQLYEFVKFRDSPFTADYVWMACNKSIEKSTVIEALSQLEEEGKLVRLTDGSYLPAEAALKKWIQKLYEEIEIPKELYQEIENFIKQTGFFKSPEELIKKALEMFIMTKKPLIGQNGKK